jgi:hypothetical protein
VFVVRDFRIHSKIAVVLKAIRDLFVLLIQTVVEVIEFALNLNVNVIMDSIGIKLTNNAIKSQDMEKAVIRPSIVELMTD